MMANTFAHSVLCTALAVTSAGCALPLWVCSIVLVTSRMFRLQAYHGICHCVGASVEPCCSVWPGQLQLMEAADAA